MIVTTKLLHSISRERFSPYLKLADNSDLQALQLYEFNIKLSESFYPSLHNLEISLRNNFHLAIAKKYGKDWILNRKLLAGMNNREFVNLSKIDEIISKLQTQDINKIISNLSFGFWVSLLYPNYEISLWRPCLREIFPHDKKILRKEIHQKLENAKFIRNRIAHHEFILKHDLQFHHTNIYELISYFCADFVKWTKDLDDFNYRWQKYENFLESKK